MMFDENLLRSAVFTITFLAVALCEVYWPRRNRHFSKRIRWQRNLGLIGIDTIIVRLVMPFTVVMIAESATQYHVGLLNLVAWPLWIKAVVALIWMDLVIYWQHRWFHQLKSLWRLHKVHHLDMDIDVTSGLRFHPGEILLSFLVKSAAVVFMGVPGVMVIVSESLINSAAMFNHGNLAIPSSVDRLLRRILVTPDMHRIHHSVLVRETNSNYGFCLSWWDYLFNSYTDQPDKGHDAMELGLSGYRTFEKHTLLYLLKLPFVTFRQSGLSAKK